MSTITWKQKSSAHPAIQLDHIYMIKWILMASLRIIILVLVEIYHGNLGSESTQYQNQKLEIGFSSSGVMLTF